MQRCNLATPFMMWEQWLERNFDAKLKSLYIFFVRGMAQWHPPPTLPTPTSNDVNDDDRERHFWGETKCFSLQCRNISDSPKKFFYFRWKNELVVVSVTWSSKSNASTNSQGRIKGGTFKFGRKSVRKSTTILSLLNDRVVNYERSLLVGNQVTRIEPPPFRLSATWNQCAQQLWPKQFSIDWVHLKSLAPSTNMTT